MLKEVGGGEVSGEAEEAQQENCVGQKNGPSRQLEVPDNSFDEVMEPICSSAAGIRLALGCLEQSAELLLWASDAQQTNSQASGHLWPFSVAAVAVVQH